MGVGNMLMRDDGVGVHVVRALRQTKPPPGVEVIDAGTSALDTIQLLRNVDRLIVIDAVKGGGEPGTLYRLSLEDISETRLQHMSLHQLTLLEALDMARLTGDCPEVVVIVGVEPKDISVGMQLSTVIEEKIPQVISVVTELLSEPLASPRFSEENG